MTRCHACGRTIDGIPMLIGSLVLCPKLCIPEPEPDISAQVEQFALTEARKKSRLV